MRWLGRWILAVPNRVYLALAGAEAALIWYFSSRTWESAEKKLPNGFGNLMHLILYGTLAGAVFLGQKRRRSFAARAAIAVAAAVTWGLVDEIHQFHVPGRSCSLFDLFDDLTGAAAAVFLLGAIVQEAAGARRYLVFALALTGLGIWGALDLGERFPAADGSLARAVARFHAR